MSNGDKLGLGLDDIIRNTRTSNRRGGGGRGGGNRGFRGQFGRGGGDAFRNRDGGGISRTQNAPGGRWKHDLYENNGSQNRTGQKNAGVNSTTKLLISNLDFGVTTADIEELFGDIGAVRVARVHFDEAGQSLGTAEIVYERRADAVSAQKKYNSLNLDGRPMDIRVVGGDDDRSLSIATRLSSSNSGAGGNRNQRFGNRNNNNNYNNNNNEQNGVRGNRPRGGRQQNGAGGKKEEVTADDLDADLEAYRAESKQAKE